MSGFYNKQFFNASTDNGYWSPSTATSTFCEQSYGTSYYIGEFVNTLSNLAYIYFALCPPRWFSAPEAARQHTRYDVHTLTLLLVGTTSALFHATLRHIPQLLDESSMYFLAAGFCWDLLTTNYTSTSQSKHNPSSKTYQVTHVHRLLTATLILLTTLASTSFTLATGNLAIHSITFALMLIVSGSKLLSLLRSPYVSASTRQRLWRKFILANVLVDVGFALWWVDCTPEWCAVLREWRGMLVEDIGVLGKVVGWTTELHGWWHGLTAASAAVYSELIRELTTGHGERVVSDEGKKRD